jgi:CrcB protein
MGGDAGEKGNSMMNAIFVGLGGAIGAMMRYGTGVGASKWLGINFPYGTLAVNIAGCFIMGLLVGLFSIKDPVNPALKLFLTTGVLGGFTTFSAFSLETVMLYDRKPMLAVSYVALSVIVSVAACALGLKLYAR